MRERQWSANMAEAFQKNYFVVLLGHSVKKQCWQIYLYSRFSAMFLDSVPKEDFKTIVRWASADLPGHCASLDYHNRVVSSTFVFHLLMAGNFFKPQRLKVNKSGICYIYFCYIGIRLILTFSNEGTSYCSFFIYNF